MAEKRQNTSVEAKVPLLSVRPISARRPITISQILPTIARLRLFCGLLPLFGAFLMLTGCAVPERKVLATWRGDFIGQGRANEEFTFGPPMLDAVSDGEEPGSLQIDTKQKQLATFDLEKRYEQVGAVRNLSPEQAKRLRGDSAKTANMGVFLGGMWLLPPVGASLTAGAAVIDNKKAQKRNEAENEVIQQLRDGESAVTIPVDYRWSTLETQYKREIVGQGTEPDGSGTEETLVAAAQVPLKIENSQYPAQQVKGRTDDSGKVSFDLATTFAEAAELRIGRWKVSAKLGGKWQELGVANITPEWIARVVDDLRDERLRAVGKPELPPAAGVSLKVSNGRLQAGMQSDIALTVFNVGKGEFYRLVATTESAVPALNGLKFDFGKLGAREGLTLVRRIRIPRRQPAGQAVVRFRWSELNGYAPESVDAEIPLKGSSGP